jgi:hypothetical protein
MDEGFAHEALRRRKLRAMADALVERIDENGPEFCELQVVNAARA